MQRRILLAFGLSFAVVFGFQLLVKPPEQQTARSSSTNPSMLKRDAAATAAGSAALRPSASVSAAVIGEALEREIVVETRDVVATFTNRGARLRHWVLKGYSTESGEPVDLVPEGMPEGIPLPLSVSTVDGEQTKRLNSALFRMSRTEARVDARDEALRLEFSYESADGETATKVVEIQPLGYQFQVAVRIKVGGRDVASSVEWGPGLGDEPARVPESGFLGGGYRYPAEGFVSRDGSVERFAASAIESTPTQSGPVEFAGVNDHYFVSSVIRPAGAVQVRFGRLVVPEPGSDGAIRTLVSYGVTPAGSEPLHFFAGPKQFDLLRAVDPSFTRIINFGMFAWLAVPLLGALKWVNGYVGNYGWSIVILTILINVVMWPLRHRSMVSMRRMQELQPQVKAIQDRYAGLSFTDPARQKMNEEMSALYREKGVNPAGGCVPMLLTMPALFAFYALLSQAIEIRGAVFGGWITDLSQHDPYFVTPLLMGVSMFVQQKMTPSSADPTQQKVMMLMPVMFTVMFLWAPSGLVVYWLVSNVWAIGQQYATTRMVGPSAVPVGRSSGGGAKSVGSGRTPEAGKR